MAFPIIPFAKLPRKYWDDQAEKKGRIEVIDPPSSEEEEDEVVSIASSSSSEYDLIQHLQDLLPGDLVDGQKPNKAANTAHLDDLKVQKKRVDRLKYVKQAYHFLKTFRERERERRKHYILAEFEQKVKAYDEMCRKKIQDELDAHEKATKLEAHRRLERIKRNSKKVKSSYTLYINVYLC